MSQPLSAYSLSLWSRVEVINDATTGAIVLQAPGRRVTLHRSAPGVRAVVNALADTGLTPEDACATALLAGGVADAAQVDGLLSKLAEAGLLKFTLTADGAPLAACAPAAAGFRFSPEPLSGGMRYVLSRFAHIHRDGDGLVLESPLSRGCVLLYDWRGPALLSALVHTRNAEGLAGVMPPVSEEIAASFLGLLAGAGMLVAVSGVGVTLEDEDPALSQWEFHDLLFHSRSRMGRRESGFGATYRFRDRFVPLPAAKPPMSEEIISLEAPDLEHLMETDIPFTRVLEERRSIRAYGERCITLRQLSEFLYRSARAREIVAAEPMDMRLMLYPTGGALAAEEVYVVANTCDGLPAGLYHYDPVGHRLYRIAGRTPQVESLIGHARSSTGTSAIPQVLIVLTARFQRLAWKYESVAYSLALKDVGGIYQTMYLVATAMGLAGCALGGGDADVFTEAAGLDCYRETSVGEFMLATTDHPESGI